MKKKRHKPEQIINLLADIQTALSGGAKLEALCQAQGISKQSYYRWKKEYGDMTSSEAKRLRSLEIENERLKKLLAEEALDKAILKEALDFAKKV